MRVIIVGAVAGGASCAAALPDAGLRDEIASLRNELEQPRADAEARLPDLEERMDFVERALVDPARRGVLERKQATPA